MNRQPLYSFTSRTFGDTPKVEPQDTSLVLFQAQQESGLVTNSLVANGLDMADPVDRQILENLTATLENLDRIIALTGRSSSQRLHAN